MAGTDCGSSVTVTLSNDHTQIGPRLFDDLPRSTGRGLVGKYTAAPSVNGVSDWLDNRFFDR